VSKYKLFSLEPSVSMDGVQSRTLMVTIGSYGDIGSSQRLINDHLENCLPNWKIGHFDADQLVNYVADRPLILFKKDHYSGFEKPEFILHHFIDSSGEPFLLLTGPEPALAWDALSTEISHLIDEFGVEQTVLLHSIPAPHPHTRPTQITEYAGKPGQSQGTFVINGTFKMSASYQSRLAVVLDEAGKKVSGLIAHVPHYLADVDYPDASICLLEGASRVSGLTLPTSALLPAAENVQAQLKSQVEDNPDLAHSIREYEHRFDQVMKERGLPGGIELIAEEDLPTADEIGREFEEYLKGLDQNDGTSHNKEENNGD